MDATSAQLLSQWGMLIRSKSCLEYSLRVLWAALVAVFTEGESVGIGLLIAVLILFVQLAFHVQMVLANWTLIVLPYLVAFLIWWLAWHLFRANWRVHRATIHCCEDIWQLKQEMREIKRCYPDCKFVRSPLPSQHWSPLVGQPETGDSGRALDLALAWYKQFVTVCDEEPAGLYLDFDGTLGYLDKLERKRRGLAV